MKYLLGFIFVLLAYHLSSSFGYIYAQHDGGYGGVDGGYDGGYDGSDSGYGNDGGYNDGGYGTDGSYGSPPGPFQQGPPIAYCAGVGSPRIVLAWNDAPRAVTYKVLASDAAVGPIIDNNYTTTQLTFTITGGTNIIPGHQYSFIIQAFNGSGNNYSDNGTWSSTKFATFYTFPDCNPPPVSTISSFTQACQAYQDSRMTVTWTNPDPSRVKYYVVTPAVTGPLSSIQQKDTYSPPGFYPDSSGSLSSGLVSYWNMNEVSGTTVDDLRDISNGAATNTTIVAANKPGNAFFASARNTNTAANGSGTTNGYITIPDHVGFASGYFTVAGWIKPQGTTPFGVNNWASIFNRRPPANDAGMTLEYYGSASGGGNGEIQCRLKILQTSGAPGDIGLISPSTAGGRLTANQWNHVACAYDGATAALYINGLQVTAQAISGTVAQSTGMNIQMGRNLIDTSIVNGVLDEFGFWNRGLSNTEVAALYNGDGSGNGNIYSLANTGGEPNGRLAPIGLSNIPPVDPQSTIYQIPNPYVAGETWQFWITAYNDWGSTPVSGNATNIVPAVNCEQPTITYSINYTPSSGGGPITPPFDTSGPNPQLSVTTNSGGAYTLTWGSTNTESPGSNCSRTGSWSGLGTSGNTPTSITYPPDLSKTHTLTCTNNNLATVAPLAANKSAAIIVNVSAPKPYFQTTGGDVHTNETIYITPPN